MPRSLRYSPAKMPLFLRSFSILAGLSLTGSAYGLYLDGEGHYALRGTIETAPGSTSAHGQYRAIEQSFRLKGEARLNDNSSFFLQFRLFDDPRKAYLGDPAGPYDCEAGTGTDCAKAFQNTVEPGYGKYMPKVSQLYARYAFDYCILEAGRRPRQWGLGAFLDAGDAPFAATESVFDGVSCEVNIQKSQALGFKVGYDKLTETGMAVRPKVDDTKRTYGALNNTDDIDQYFLSIEYDDRKVNASSDFTKQIGIYAAKLFSDSVEKGGSSSELTFVDIYSNLFYQSYEWQNEIILTIGKSGDPNLVRLGGAYQDKGNLAVNQMNTIALAGKFEWTVASSGSHVGPAVYRQGDAKRHVVYLSYAYAPGDSDGYYSENRTLDPAAKESSLDVKNRDTQIRAFALNRNFKPALILFNGRAEIDPQLRVDGVFEPGRVMNTKLFGLGYRYETLAYGNFEGRGVVAFLNEVIPESLKSYYVANPNKTRPIGYYGDLLGTEVDFLYNYHWRRDVDFGAAFGVLISGDAWRVSEAKKPKLDFLGQLSTTFHF